MQDNTNKLITVIIPIFNEYEGIPFLVDSLNEFFRQNSNINAEVIFVNDGSRDNSVDRLVSMKHETYKAKVISFSRNFGSHAALRAGISHSSGDYICFNYADLQDPLELIIQMKELMEQGNDIIWAQRESTKVPWGEKMFSKFYAYLMQKFAFKNFPEKGFDIVMFNKKVAAEVNKNVEANSSIFLQILGMGFRQTNITYKKRERQTGVSKWTLSKKIKLFIDSFVAFSYAPIRFVTIVGIAFFFVGVLWAVYIIVRKLVFDDLAAGWPAMMSILMIGFGITNISLGIIAEYLWRTLDASRKRQVFIIDDIKELNKWTKAVLYCALYALLNVSGAAIIKWNLKGKVLTTLSEWVNLLLNIQVIGAFALIFVSMLVIFKALSSANFTFVIPVSAGINFVLTVIAGYYIFKDHLNMASFIGFALIISGIILLSINSTQHAAE